MQVVRVSFAAGPNASPAAPCSTMQVVSGQICHRAERCAAEPGHAALRASIGDHHASLWYNQSNNCRKCIIHKRRVPIGNAKDTGADNRRSPRHYVADCSFSEMSTSSSLWQTSGLPDGSYPFLLRTMLLPQNKSKFQMHIIRLPIILVIYNQDIVDYIAGGLSIYVN